MDTYFCPCLNCEIIPSKGGISQGSSRFLSDALQLTDDSIPHQLFSTINPTQQQFLSSSNISDHSIPSTIIFSPITTSFFTNSAGIDSLHIKHPYLVSFVPIEIGVARRSTFNSPSLRSSSQPPVDKEPQQQLSRPSSLLIQSPSAIPSAISTAAHSPSIVPISSNATSSTTSPSAIEPNPIAQPKSKSSLFFLLTCNNCTFPLALFHSQSPVCILSNTLLQSSIHHKLIETKLTTHTSQTYKIVIFPTISQSQFYPQPLQQVDALQMDDAFEYVDNTIAEFLKSNFPNPSARDMLIPHLSHLFQNQNHLIPNDTNNILLPSPSLSPQQSPQKDQNNQNNQNYQRNSNNATIVEETVNILHTTLQHQRNIVMNTIQQQLRFNLAHHNAFLAVSLLESRTLVERVTAATNLTFQQLNSFIPASNISQPIPYLQFLASFTPDRSYNESSPTDPDTTVSLKSFNYSYLGSIVFPNDNNDNEIRKTLPPHPDSTISTPLAKTTTTSTSHIPLTFQYRAVNNQHNLPTPPPVKIASTSSLHSIFAMNHSFGSFIPTSASSSSRELRRSSDHSSLHQNQDHQPHQHHSPISQRFGAPLPSFQHQASFCPSSNSNQLSISNSSTSQAHTHSPSFDLSYSKPLPMLPQPNNAIDDNLDTDHVVIEPLQFQSQQQKHNASNSTTPGTAPINSSTALNNIPNGGNNSNNGGDGSTKQTPKSGLSSQPSSDHGRTTKRTGTGLAPSALQQKSQDHHKNLSNTTSSTNAPQYTSPTIKSSSIPSPNIQFEPNAIFPIDLDEENTNTLLLNNPEDIIDDEDDDDEQVGFLYLEKISQQQHQQHSHQIDTEQLDTQFNSQQSQLQQPQSRNIQQQYQHPHLAQQDDPAPFIAGSIAIPTRVPVKSPLQADTDNNIDPQRPPTQSNFVVGSVHQYDDMINALQVAQLMASQGDINLTPQQLHHLQRLQQQPSQQSQQPHDETVNDKQPSPPLSPSPQNAVNREIPLHLGSLAQQLAIHGLLKK